MSAILTYAGGQPWWIVFNAALFAVAMIAFALNQGSQWKKPPTNPKTGTKEMASISISRSRAPLAVGTISVLALPSDNAFMLRLPTTKQDGKSVHLTLKDFELIEVIKAALKYANDDPHHHGAYDSNLLRGASFNYLYLP